VVKHAHRKPSREEVLSIVDDASRYDGNATTNEIRLRLGSAFGWHTEPTEAQLRAVLSTLLSEDLIVKDGTRHDGGHFALTFKGKQKLARLREHQAQAA
jgi:DNA-binding PadR family transcriptional regulator